MGKVYDGIIGLIVGDALGVPYEFKRRDSFTASDMVGYGTHYQPPGTWSDDSSMTLATLESLLIKGKIDTEDIMNNFVKWLIFGDFTPYGDVFDVGNTTRTAIHKYRNNWESPVKCGGTSEADNGNGSLMRILPLAFVKPTLQDVCKVSSLTHAHVFSRLACAVYIDVAENLLSGGTEKIIIKPSTLRNYHKFLPSKYERLQQVGELSRNKIKSTGYVIDTLEAALWCFINTDNYKDCVLTAVNLGGDTDTIAAVAGGLAGIYYGIGGESGIPEEWIAKIPRHFWIKEMCEDFERKFN